MIEFRLNPQIILFFQKVFTIPKDLFFKLYKLYNISIGDVFIINNEYHIVTGIDIYYHEQVKLIDIVLTPDGAYYHTMCSEELISKYEHIS